MSIVIYKMCLFNYNTITYDCMTENQNGFKIVLSIIPVVYFYVWPLLNLNKWHWSPSWSFMLMTTFIMFKTLDVISKKKWIQSFMQYMYFQLRDKNYSVWQLKSFYLITIVLTVNFQSAMIELYKTWKICNTAV